MELVACGCGRRRGPPPFLSVLGGHVGPAELLANYDGFVTDAVRKGEWVFAAEWVGGKSVVVVGHGGSAAKS